MIEAKKGYSTDQKNRWDIFTTKKQFQQLNYLKQQDNKSTKINLNETCGIYFLWIKDNQAK